MPLDPLIYISEKKVLRTNLAGYVAASGTITSRDSILEAIQKLDANIAAVVGGAIPGGTVDDYYRGNGTWEPLTTARVSESVGYLYFTNHRAINATVSGYAGGWPGTIVPSDTIIQAITKLDGNITALGSGSSSITLAGAVTGTGSGTITTTLALSSVLIANLAASGTPSSSTFLRGDNTWSTLGVSGTNTGDQNIFSTIAVAGQTNVVADATSDTLTLIAGTGIGITTNAGSDSVTFSVTGSTGSNYYNTIYIDQSGGTGDTYGAVSGLINGSNALFNVSQNLYATGSLKVFLNGQLLTQGSSEDWVETNPSLGTFTFNTAPISGDLISVEYQLTEVGSGSGGPITLTGAVTGYGTSTIATTLAPSSVGISNLSASGSPSASKYLRGDNTWATVVAGGSGSTNDIELTLQMISLISYVEFTYDLDGNITNKDIWEDNTMLNKYYSISYSYTGDDLTSIEVTRETDSFTYTKTYAYSGGNLASITIT